MAVSTRPNAILQRHATELSCCCGNSLRLSTVRRHVASRAGREDLHINKHETLDALDALLQTDEQQQQQQNSSSNAEQLVPWWQLKAQQSAPPRQTLLHPPGEVARFVADQALYSSKVRSGRSTALGGELDLPQVDPYFCYLVLSAQLAVYAAGTWLAVSSGPGAAEQWALALAMQPGEAAAGGEAWRLLSCLLLHGGLTHLALDTFFLGWMGPGIEALLGHGVFIYIYLLSGLAGSTAVMLTGDLSEPTACATAATVGLVGAMVGYEAKNQAIVRQTLRSRHSKAEDGRAGTSTLRKPLGAFGLVCLMLGLGFLPGTMINNAAHVAGMTAGVGLGYVLGPNFTLIQEVDIPEGSMAVPEDAPETVVVLDRRTGLERAVNGTAALALLAGIIALGPNIFG